MTLPECLAKHPQPCRTHSPSPLWEQIKSLLWISAVKEISSNAGRSNSNIVLQDRNNYDIFNLCLSVAPFGTSQFDNRSCLHNYIWARIKKGDEYYNRQ